MAQAFVSWLFHYHVQLLQLALTVLLLNHILNHVRPYQTGTKH